METNPNDSLYTQPAMEVRERPQFLTVLCILTWVACGIIFITTMMKVLFQPSPEQQARQVELMREQDPALAEKFEEALEIQNHSSQIANTGITLGALFASAFGAWGMWRLRKRGFLIYTAGEVLPYLGFLITGTDELAATASMAGMEPGAFVALALGIVAFFDLLFILLYAANLKHMR